MKLNYDKIISDQGLCIMQMMTNGDGPSDSASAIIALLSIAQTAERLRDGNNYRHETDQFLIDMLLAGHYDSVEQFIIR